MEVNIQDPLSTLIPAIHYMEMNISNYTPIHANEKNEVQKPED
jgi:hypothetical protein